MADREPAPLIVLDTSVVVAAVQGNSRASSSRVVRRISTGGLRLALSDAFLAELTGTLQDPDLDRRIRSAGRAFEAGADAIVTWDPHLQPAKDLGFEVLAPPELLEKLDH